MYILEFIISSAIIVFAGIRLTAYADQLSKHLKLGHMWVGIVLLGAVTSLPEAVTCFVSVVSLSSIDLAVGNLLGSNNFNPLLIVVMDFLYRQGSITNAIKPEPSHRTAAFYSIGLTLIVMAEIVQGFIDPIPHLGPLTMGGFLIVVVYFFGMDKLREQSAEAYQVPQDEKEQAVQTSLKKILTNVIVSAVVVILAAVWLTHAADELASKAGLGQTFVGSIFLAFVTSLPEMVVTISALRMGAINLAVGNIFGSNMTNIFILFLCGLLYFDGPILGYVSLGNNAMAFLSIVLSYILVQGIQSKDKGVYKGMGYDTILMLFIYLLGVGILYVIK